MKKLLPLAYPILIAILIGLLPVLAHAQKTHGQVIYKEAFKVELDMEGMEGMEELVEMIKQSTTSKMELLFDQSTSLYRAYKAPEGNGPVNSAGMDNVNMVVMKPEAIFHRDLKAMKATEQVDLLGKRFLIKDEIQKLAWKMTGKTKELHGYPCMEATYIKGADTVQAWFTSAIPVPAGPGKYGQLPGLILELDVNNGQRTLVAKDLNFKKPAKSDMKAPNKGKQVTREEFNQIQKEKMAEMGANGGGKQMHIEISTGQ